MWSGRSLLTFQMCLLPPSPGWWARISEMSLNFYQTTWCNNTEDSHLHSYCHDNLKSHLECSRFLIRRMICYNLLSHCGHLIFMWDLRFSWQWQCWWCYFGLSHCVDWLVEAKISEKRAVSIFRAEDGDSMLLQNIDFYQWAHTATLPKRAPSELCIQFTAW
jgi:hypothetical protein